MSNPYHVANIDPMMLTLVLIMILIDIDPDIDLDIDHDIDLLWSKILFFINPNQSPRLKKSAPDDFFFGVAYGLIHV